MFQLFKNVRLDQCKYYVLDTDAMSYELFFITFSDAVEVWMMLLPFLLFLFLLLWDIHMNLITQTINSYDLKNIPTRNNALNAMTLFKYFCFLDINLNILNKLF